MTRHATKNGTGFMWLAGLACVGTLGLAACDKKADAGKAEPSAAGEPAAAASVDVTKRPPVVQGYEKLRDALAHDDLEAAKAAGVELGKAVTDVKLDERIATMATGLGKAPDLASARLVFGEISRAYLTAMKDKPDLAGGQVFVFRCPMAEGYQKWVQLDETMKNPYMGKKMLDCGSKSDLIP